MTKNRQCSACLETANAGKVEVPRAKARNKWFHIWLPACVCLWKVLWWVWHFSHGPVASRRCCDVTAQCSETFVWRCVENMWWPPSVLVYCKKVHSSPTYTVKVLQASLGAISWVHRHCARAPSSDTAVAFYLWVPQSCKRMICLKRKIYVQVMYCAHVLEQTYELNKNIWLQVLVS